MRTNADSADYYRFMGSRPRSLSSFGGSVVFCICQIGVFNKLSRDQPMTVGTAEDQTLLASLLEQQARSVAAEEMSANILV